MTFAEVKKLVLDQITPQYVSFSWENDYYSDGEVTTECRIYIECVKAHYRGQTWQAAYDRFAEEFCVPSTVTCSPCPRRGGGMRNKKEYLRRHWILWNWLAENSGCDDKGVAFAILGWDSSSKIDNPKSHCYLCELFMGNRDCPECPLQKASGTCDYKGAEPNYYDSWYYAQTNTDRRKYALLIRDVVPKPEDV